jgi:hypothetical protein
MTSTGAGGELSFARDIRPLFREKDRDSMMRAFDLFDYADVVEHADAIVGALRSGKMPCDSVWPASQVDSSSSGLTRASPPDFSQLAQARATVARITRPRRAASNPAGSSAT